MPHQTLTLLALQDGRKINQQVQQLKLAALGQLSLPVLRMKFVILWQRLYKPTIYLQ